MTKEVIEVNRKILVIAVALLAIALFVTPVMAIGPFGASDNDNPNFWIDPVGAIWNYRGKAVGNIIWSPQPLGQPRTYWSEWRWFDASSGGGKVNNAIAADMSTIGEWVADMAAYANGLPTVNENRWIFLSPEPSNGPHGMVWRMMYISYLAGGMSSADAAEAATFAAAQYPKGVFWRYNFIG
jgi:hypothetical protein